MKKRVFSATVQAKLNLRLSITGRRGNLHTLDMLVCPYEKMRDVVLFVPDKKAGEISKVKIFPLFSGFDRKRFLKFYVPKVNLISQKLGVGGRLYVFKGVPLGAGLGGSSASIVGALKAMTRYAEQIGKSTRLDDEFLLSLGSDVPCMTRGKACRVQGVGEKVTEVSFALPSQVRVKIAKGGSSSEECYKLFDVTCDARTTDERGALFNDLTAPAVALNPLIGDLISQMKEKYEHVVMSGSGSAVIGINKKR